MTKRTIFVFGSNLAGRHGAGAALDAKRHYKAVTGVGRGLTGNAYALPTKDELLRTRSLPEIKKEIEDFVAFAKSQRDMMFLLTPVGTGLAGHRVEDIWNILCYFGIPSNVVLTSSWIYSLGQIQRG